MLLKNHDCSFEQFLNLPQLILDLLKLVLNQLLVHHIILIVFRLNLLILSFEYVLAHGLHGIKKILVSQLHLIITLNLIFAIFD